MQHVKQLLYNIAICVMSFSGNCDCHITVVTSVRFVRETFYDWKFVDFEIGPHNSFPCDVLKHSTAMPHLEPL